LIRLIEIGQELDHKVVVELGTCDVCGIFGFLLKLHSIIIRQIDTLAPLDQI